MEDPFVKISNRLDTIFESAKKEMKQIASDGNLITDKTLPEDLELDIDQLSKLDNVPAVNESTEIEPISETTAIINYENLIIKNQQYIEDKAKQFIGRSEEVLNKLYNALSTECSPNILPRMAEVYGNVTNSVSLLLRELRELSKIRLHADITTADYILRAKSGEKEKEKNKADCITLSSSQLLKIIKDSRNEIKIDADEAEYVVVEEPKNVESKN
jgi:hypothetical protein